ncbi:MAG: WD40 repeat domain-containing protein [Planctomycetota bacterium]
MRRSHRLPSLAPVLLVATAVALAAGSAAAQCQQFIPPGTGLPGLDGVPAVTALWDPDGGGPLAPRLMVGGTFDIAGTTACRNIAAYDLAAGAFAPLAQGLDGVVSGMATLANGDLVVAGTFGGPPGILTPGLARWNGSSWSAVGNGVDLAAYDVVVLPNGDLIATGLFSQASGVPANHIVRWNGSVWSPLGSGLGGTFPFGEHLAVLPSGDVVVAGQFTSAGGVPANRIARYDGAAWHALPGLPDASIRALAITTTGDIYAAPYAPSVTSGGLWRWNGTSWVGITLGGGSADTTYPYVGSLQALPGGGLLVGGRFGSIAGVPALHLARFDGSSWSAVGDADNPESSLAYEVPGGEVFAGGAFFEVGQRAARGLVRWDGAAWQQLGGGVPGSLSVQTVLPDGRRVVAVSEFSLGRFRVFEEVAGEWIQVGSPSSTGEGVVRALAVLPNGDLIAGGDLELRIGGIMRRCVARWNGTAWEPLGDWLQGNSGLGWIGALTVLPDGRLLAGGYFDQIGTQVVHNLAVWDGVQWTSFGGGVNGIGLGANSGVFALQALPNGDVVVGGYFATAGGVSASKIARFDGATWHPLGGGMSPPQTGARVYALALLPDGRLVAGGSFDGAGGLPAARVAVWDGVSWSALGSGVDGTVLALETLPGGELLVGGSFSTAGGIFSPNLARWDGQWSAVGFGASSAVRSLEYLPQGRLSIGGDFDFVAGVLSPGLAELRTTCPGNVVSFGPGCTGSGGQLSLSGVDVPMLGGDVHYRVDGLAAGSLLLRMIGLGGPPVTLSSLHPAGGQGCFLLIQPIETLLGFPPHGSSIDGAIAIPSSPTLLNAVFRLQYGEIEFDASLAISRINSTNAMALTIGSF